MSKSAIDDLSWAELSAAQRAEAVRAGRATLKQMMAGLLDGPDVLHHACRDFLLHTDASFADLPVQTTEPDLEGQQYALKIDELRDSLLRKSERQPKKILRQRFGLPSGFSPRLQRFTRSRLLEGNIYKLPTGQEYVPCHPVGLLGKLRHHQYALPTIEQYLSGRRGSVYICDDGRIFDYSCDNGNPMLEMFDTGYTIDDLERTGQYASDSNGDKKAKRLKCRRAAQAG